MAPLDPAAFPVTKEWVYLNHAGVCPMPASTIEAMHAQIEQVSTRGGMYWSEHHARLEQVRVECAALMRVPTGDLALTKNTTEGLAFVAEGLGLKPGDRVVIPNHEFPSTIFPWYALRDRGVIVDLVEPTGPTHALPLEAFAETIAAGPAPKVVATSWVQAAHGWRTEIAGLAKLCREAGALLCVDAIQGLGAIPGDFEAWGADFVAAGSHKWMLGPQGAGVLYVRESVRERVRPSEAGWASVAQREEWDNLELVFDESARRFEGGSYNMVGLFGMGASAALINEAGPDAVFAHVTELLDRATAGLLDLGAEILSDTSPDHRSGIVTFSIPGHDPSDLHEGLLQSGIMCPPRADGLRLSPHGYNTPEDIARLLEALGRLTAVA